MAPTVLLSFGASFGRSNPISSGLVPPVDLGVALLPMFCPVIFHTSS